MNIDKFTKSFAHNELIRKTLEEGDKIILMALLKHIGGKYEWKNESEAPILMVWIGDGIQDAFVNSISIDDKNWVTVNVRPKEDFDNYDITLSDMPDGQLQYFADYMEFDNEEE